MVSASSSRRRANVHRTFASYGSSPTRQIKNGLSRMGYPVFGTPEGTRNTMVPASSSRRRANVHRTFAFYCSSPKYENNPNPSPTEIRFGSFCFGTSVFMGLWERRTMPTLFRDEPVPASSTSLRDASETGGTLPRAKNSPPDCFYGIFRCRRPFESHPSNQKRAIPDGIPRFWYARRDSNPQPSEPESDALSIEPLAHLLSVPLIIAGKIDFVKRQKENILCLLLC